MPAAFTLLQAFGLANEWFSSLKGRNAALEWRRHRQPSHENLLAEMQAQCKAWHDSAAMAWMAFSKKGEAAMDAAALKAAGEAFSGLAEHVENEADALEPLVQRRGEIYSFDEGCLLVAGLLFRASREEQLAKGWAALQLRDKNLKAPPRDAAGLDDAPKRYGMLLEKDAGLEPWDARMLRAHAASLPAMLRALGMQLRLDAAECEEGPHDLTAEALADWKAAGLGPDELGHWFDAGFMSDEAAQWTGAGLNDPLLALDWQARGKAPSEAAVWAKAGFKPEEADCWIAAGAASMEEALKLKAWLPHPDSLRPWIRSGFSVAEAQDLHQQGVKSADQALAMRQASQQPPEPAPAPQIEAGGLKPASGVPGSIESPAEIPPLPPLPEIPALPDMPVAAPAPAVEAPPDPWTVMGVPPQTAKLWEAALFTPEQALPWLDRSIDTKTALNWQRAGILHAEKAQAWMQAGVPDGESASFLERRLKHAHSVLQAIPSPESLTLPLPPGPGALFYYGSPCSAWKPSPEEAQAYLWLSRLKRKAPAQKAASLGAVLGQVSSSGPLYAAAEATEHWATASLPAEIRSPDELEEWKLGLRGLAAGLDLDPVHPSFYLSPCAGQAENMHAVLFWGWAYGDIDGAPWQESMDFLASEGWAKRWWRKTDEWGEKGKAPSCRVGVFGEKGKPRYLVAMEKSIHVCMGPEAMKIDKLDSHASWREEWEDFSRVMDLPLKRGRWMLALADMGEKPEVPEG